MGWLGWVEMEWDDMGWGRMVGDGIAWDDMEWVGWDGMNGRDGLGWDGLE